MKPVAFDYRRPRSLDAALECLANTPGAKILAGGQTLGPMLNLRLVRPRTIVDITRIPALSAVTEGDESIRFGAAVTHAAIEDSLAGDPANGFMTRVARTIAYRAVRTRGTLGGSLAHADPAADWLAVLTALDARVAIAGEAGERSVPLREFVTGVFETALGDEEVLTAIDVPRLPETAGCGFYKFCRKAGEFAEAMAAAVIDDIGGTFRIVAGATDGAPILFDEADALISDDFDLDRAMSALRDQGYDGDDYDVQLHAVAMQRAWREATRS